MAFATRTDLLARCNARRLAQLSVPVDKQMPPEAALRVAIDGGDLTVYTQADQDSVALALQTIDDALADADAVILSYGIPATVQTTLLARLTSTVAMYFLQGAERMTDEMKNAYEAVIKTLKSHASGELSLIPALPTDPVIEGDVITIEASGRRYGGSGATSEDW